MTSRVLRRLKNEMYHHQQYPTRARFAVAEYIEVFYNRFWWEDTGQPLPEPAGLRLEPMSRIGPAAFVPVIGRCLAQTLDRTDALVFGRPRPEQWAGAFLDHRAAGADRPRPRADAPHRPPQLMVTGPAGPPAAAPRDRPARPAQPARTGEQPGQRCGRPPPLSRRGQVGPCLVSAPGQTR